MSQQIHLAYIHLNNLKVKKKNCFKNIYKTRGDIFLHHQEPPNLSPYTIEN
jgi:hypothetical protein